MNGYCWDCGRGIALRSNYCRECQDKLDAQGRTWQPKEKSWHPKAAAATTRRTLAEHPLAEASWLMLVEAAPQNLKLRSVTSVTV